MIKLIAEREHRLVQYAISKWRLKREQARYMNNGYYPALIILQCPVTLHQEREVWEKIFNHVMAHYKDAIRHCAFNFTISNDFQFSAVSGSSLTVVAEELLWQLKGVDVETFMICDNLDI